jgi:HEAT repeat protein
MHALVSVDPTWIASLIPKYLAALDSPDFFQAVEAIWRLVQFRAPTALPRLLRLADRASHPAARNNARVGPWCSKVRKMSLSKPFKDATTVDVYLGQGTCLSWHQEGARRADGVFGERKR